MEAVCSIQEVVQWDKKKSSSYQVKGGGGIWGLRNGDLAPDPCTCHCSTEEGTPVMLVSGYIHQVFDRPQYVQTYLLTAVMHVNSHTLPSLTLRHGL